MHFIVHVVLLMFYLIRGACQSDFILKRIFGEYLAFWPQRASPSQAGLVRGPEQRQPEARGISSGERQSHKPGGAFWP